MLCCLVVLGAVVVLMESRRPPDASTTSRDAGAPAPHLQNPPTAATSVAARPSAEPDPVPYIEGQVWGDIDLREVQVVMPDNLYWQLGAPTKDPAVLEAREKRKSAP